MARRSEEYLADILDAAAAIRAYTKGGKRAFLHNPMARDAVIARILQIGEAVKGAQAGGIDLHGLAPEVPWLQIAGMRDLVSHQYWRTDPEIVWAVAEKDLRPLEAAVRKIRLRRRRR
ncbi:MAG: HepT-like ribonuclease domain-containing protein [Burkholderiales bacterium]